MDERPTIDELRAEEERMKAFHGYPRTGADGRKILRVVEALLRENPKKYTSHEQIHAAALAHFESYEVLPKKSHISWALRYLGIRGIGRTGYYKMPVGR